MTFVLVVFAVLISLGLFGSIAESVATNPSPAERHRLQPRNHARRASIHLPASTPKEFVEETVPERPDKLPHVGYFDDTAFESIAYKALVAAAEERIDRIAHADGSDL